MKKNAVVVLMITFLIFAITACGSNAGTGGNGNAAAPEGGAASGGAEVAAPEAGPASGTINVWAHTVEISERFDDFKAYYKEKNGKDFPYEFNSTIVNDQDNQYMTAITPAFAGGSNVPDVYVGESASVLTFTQGDLASYAATYKELGIDVDSLVKEAKIAQYTIDIGTRPSDGEIVGLCYQSTGGAMIYRRSIAKDVWGNDDPNFIKEKVGSSPESFIAAGADLKAKGYTLLSGTSDLWNALRNDPSIEHGWIVDDKLSIPAGFLKMFDYAKELKDKGYMQDNASGSDAGYAAIKGEGAEPVFCWLGPAWYINYTIKNNFDPATIGDWAVTASPIPFWWGGTWIMANKNSKYKEAIGEFIYWWTLDTSEKGLQYGWANGLFNDSGTKDTVSSAVVMEKSNGESDILGGQNMFDQFVPATANAGAKNLGQYDNAINGLYMNEVNSYKDGLKDKDAAIADFKANVKSQLDYDSAD